MLVRSSSTVRSSPTFTPFARIVASILSFIIVYCRTFHFIHHCCIDTIIMGILQLALL